MAKTVAIGGKFDPIHDGHIDYIRKASKLGDYLYIMVNTDESVARYSAKKFCAVPLESRIILLEGLLLYFDIHGEVVVTVDTDGLVAETLRILKPDVFAKGGDRTPENMAENCKKELDVCREISCEVVYGIGDLLNSSARICLAATPDASP
jgi:D-beta-D-heptose 7-phosphate kinase/D-beta-D-heptose 1-phosphate adenosyltransferase